MASYKLILLERAVSELEESSVYYNKQVPGLGFEFEEEIFSLLEIIKDTPLLFPQKFANIHEASVNCFPFMITYEIIEKHVIILCVFHTKRNPAKKIKRKGK